MPDVPGYVWTSPMERFDLAEDILDAVYCKHTRMAEVLVVEAGASEYQRFSQGDDVLIIRRD